MPAPRKLPPGVRRIFRLPRSRARVARDVDDEVRFHLEMRAAELREGGLSTGEAEGEALRQFGDVEGVRAHAARAIGRRAWRTRVAARGGEWARSVAFAARRLRSSPEFTVGATLTLAIAIGATASVF